MMKASKTEEKIRTDLSPPRQKYCLFGSGAGTPKNNVRHKHKTQTI